MGFGASILLHLLLLLVLNSSNRLIRASVAPDPFYESDPLAFEFFESTAEESVPDKTDLISDRNARSRDASTEDLPRSILAHSDGLSKNKEALVTRRGGGRTTEGLQGEEASVQDGARSSSDTTPEDTRSWVRRRAGQTLSQRERAVFGVPTSPPPSVAYRNTSSRAFEEGGLQLNTYDWAFAPYLKYLKRRIQSHIFPPAAFSRLASIEGRNTVRFRIYPDGKLEALQVLRTEGSKLLLTTSLKAVELSAPFKLLPDDFPEPYLEITGLFTYEVYRDLRRRR